MNSAVEFRASCEAKIGRGGDFFINIHPRGLHPIALVVFKFFLSQFSNPVFTLHLTEDTYNRDKYKENLALSDPFINQGYQGDKGDQIRGEREFPFPVIPGNTCLKFPVPSRGILNFPGKRKFWTGIRTGNTIIICSFEHFLMYSLYVKKM